MWFVICKIIGAAFILLGAHGLYVYANPFTIGADLGNLFTEFDLGIAEVSKVIRWMSVSAIQSWITPTSFIVMGYFISKTKSGGNNNVRRAA